MKNNVLFANLQKWRLIQFGINAPHLTYSVLPNAALGTVVYIIGAWVRDMYSILVPICFAFVHAPRTSTRKVFHFQHRLNISLIDFPYTASFPDRFNMSQTLSTKKKKKVYLDVIKRECDGEFLFLVKRSPQEFVWEMLDEKYKKAFTVINAYWREGTAK